MTARSTRWFLALMAVAGFALLGTPRDARAALQLSATVGGVDFMAIDNVLNDTDPTLGVLRLADQNIGGLDISGSVHERVYATSAGQFNILDSTSLAVRNDSGADVSATVAVSATDFPGPSFVAFASGSGTWETADGSSIDMAWYNDPLNRQGAGDTDSQTPDPTDTPGTLIHSFSDTAVGPADAFATSSGAVDVNDPGLYSMTLSFAFTLVDGGALISRGQTELKPLGIPEPGTLAMAFLALPLLGLGYRRHCRRQAN